jgi:hypothetical protein
MICEKCKLEFDRINFPITIPCGHNLCKRCVSSVNTHGYVCEIDSMHQEIKNNPSIEYLNLLEAVKALPELYKPLKFTESSKPFIQKTFSLKTLKNTRPVCKFYLKGCCRYGYNCWNLH